LQRWRKDRQTLPVHSRYRFSCRKVKRVCPLKKYRLIFSVITLAGCHRQTGSLGTSEVPSPRPQSPPDSMATVPARAPGSPTRPVPSPPSGLRTPDGEPLWAAEKVDANVIRVTSLSALLIEANEIRCPHVIQSSSVPVRKDTGPWQVEGDLVEADVLSAHSVSARLIIADEIRAKVIRKVKTPHRWSGAGGPSPVRNRVTAIKALMVPPGHPTF
jgi:hypothetical protein